MKIIKLLLITVLTVSAFLQALWGVWIIADISSASELFLGLIYDVIESKELMIIFGMLAKSFLMLSLYSGITIFFVIKNKREGAILSLLGGLAIASIAISTFIETGSFYVLFTDLLRGALIIILSFIFLIKYKEIIS